MTGATMGVRAAARALGVHENTVRTWMKDGRLGAHTLPTGFQRPYATDVYRLAAEPDDTLPALATALDELADRMERQAQALREAAAAIRVEP